MENDSDSNPRNTSPKFGFIWLLVGLAPIPILLSALPADRARRAWVNPVFLLILCATCNRVGGIGSLSSLKDAALRIILGILLAGFFSALSWGIVLFQACSHMHI
jgi:hypothetical protein